MRAILAVLVAATVLSGCGADAGPAEAGAPASWVYQLSDYPGGTVDELVSSPHEVAVIDLARDGGDDYFSRDEITALEESGKQVFSYFSMGSIETYRPEAADVADADLVLNRWDDWPDENFVEYWEEDWWDLVIRPRLDRSLSAGFDGAYLDVPNAYEEIDLDLVPDETRTSLGRKMTDLIIRISQYTGKRDPGFRILPQNSPELRHYDGYLDAIDGIGVEDLFFLDADRPCTAGWCRENLDDVRAIRAAGKLVLAVDYASRQSNIDAACDRYAEEDFTGYVTVVELDRIAPACR